MTQEQLNLPKALRVCAKEGCTRKGWKRGFCGQHYAAWYRKTYPERVAASVKKRREATREYHRDYYLANRKKIKARQAALYVNESTERKQQRRLKQRQWRIKSKYGLDLVEYEAILARGCAICGTQERIYLDHDHANGKVRDALCHYCNCVLGYGMDDPARLRAAADYIEQHRKETTV